MQYATDEDAAFYDSDPLTNLFDLSHDPIEFASRQMKLSAEMMPKLLSRAVKKGEGYEKARRGFNKLFAESGAPRTSRPSSPAASSSTGTTRGDPHARPPFRIVDAKQQRAGMKLLAERVFSAPTYHPKLLNYLPATHWNHWGITEPLRLDYPITQYVGMMQEIILFQLLDPITLDRLHDNELKVVGDGERYTLAEHLRLLVDSIFSEWKDGKAGKYTDQAPYIGEFRRNLQRMTLKDLADLVQTAYSGPEDARTLARMHLHTLDTQITAILQKADSEARRLHQGPSSRLAKANSAGPQRAIAIG